MGSIFLIGHRRGITGQAPQTVTSGIGQVDRDLGQFLTLAGKGLGVRLRILGDQPIEQGRALEPAKVTALREIAQHGFTRRLLLIDPK